MKRLLIMLLSTFIICIGCTKDDVSQHTTTPPPVKINRAPFANAGWGNIGVLLPQNFITLSGVAYDPDNNIVGYSWKKVAGPISYLIERPNAKETRVKDLQKGTYKFEFTVTDEAGLTDNDTVAVTVFDAPLPGPAEVILKDQRWECPWECSLVVSCLNCYVPVGTSFTIYGKQMNANDWIQVLPDSTPWTPDKYYYSIINGDIVLSGPNENLTEIKIKY